MKTFRVYHNNAKPENIQGTSAKVKKNDDNSLTVTIGRRVIPDAIMLTEVLAEAKPVKAKPHIDDDDE